ncbi:alpha/beta fold hydrolase [Nocardia terpenica]|uniref:Alpha/beta fold hydrolase n=1 Tax=Nocardia terpenica TaxID=455432 RepID=A0A6G9Z9D3_9NOCA|nr:alpha/beta hydrolase [Nocardia terpenica]QIS22074.1 alpha/beta fold hydrolase [Nocardia terpenica]
MSDYVTAGGVHTYYEVYGEGEPLILLHGGGNGAESWLGQIPELSQHFRVYVPERRGHGHTADVAGPISYRIMADDTAAFLDTLGIGAAHLVGWSDGGIVGLLVALDRPDLVRKLVAIGTYANLDGATAFARELFEEPVSSRMAEILRDSYTTSPDGPDHFPVVYDKLVRMWREEPNIDVGDLARIQAPTLLMQGDEDGVTVEHSVAMSRAIPDAQLAVIPGSSHVVPLEKPGLVNRMILDFLADDQPTKLFALRDSLPEYLR